MSEFDFGRTYPEPVDSGHRMKIIALVGGLDAEVICQAHERGERCGLNPDGPDKRGSPDHCPVEYLLQCAGLDCFTILGIGVEKVELADVKVHYQHEGWGENYEDWIAFDPSTIKEE